MQIAQQAMQQGGVIPPVQDATSPAATIGDAPDERPDMVEVRLAQLERLASLRDAGALSDAGYEAEKVKVLSGS